MSASNPYRHIPIFLTRCVLVASCFILWGCVEIPRYPSVVYTLPRCYDERPVEQKDCKDWSTDEVYLNLNYLVTKSDSLLWADIGNLMKGAKYWRLNIFKVSTGDWQNGTSKVKNAEWSPISDPTIRLKLPLEVMLLADFEFCYSDNCGDSSAKTAGRNIPFLMHNYPD
jgi:hypothetical protein